VILITSEPGKKGYNKVYTQTEPGSTQQIKIMKNLTIAGLTKKYNFITIDTDEALEALNNNSLLSTSEGNTLKLKTPISILEFSKLPGCALLVHNGWVLFS
jgi:hypothetical protein